MELHEVEQYHEPKQYGHNQTLLASQDDRPYITGKLILHTPNGDIECENFYDPTKDGIHFIDEDVEDYEVIAIIRGDVTIDVQITPHVEHTSYLQVS